MNSFSYRVVAVPLSPYDRAHKTCALLSQVPQIPCICILHNLPTQTLTIHAFRKENRNRVYYTIAIEDSIKLRQALPTIPSSQPPTFPSTFPRPHEIKITRLLTKSPLSCPSQITNTPLNPFATQVSKKGGMVRFSVPQIFLAYRRNKTITNMANIARHHRNAIPCCFTSKSMSLDYYTMDMLTVSHYKHLVVQISHQNISGLVV